MFTAYLEIMLSGVLFNSLHENQPLIVSAFLRGLKVNVSMETINETLQSHPDYPSFLSISDSLNNWKVENLVIQTSAEKLSEIPTPFITSFKQGVFVLVLEVVENEMLIVNQNGKKGTKAKNIFLSQWTENILVAEANEFSGEINYQQKINAAIVKTAIYSSIPIGILASLLIPFINGSITLLSTLYLLAKLIGLTASVLLLWYDIDKGNPLLKQICSGIQKANCSAVLNTKAATLGGMVTWSEVGFIYFAGSLLFSALAGINAVLPVLSLFSLLALPYIIFSIYYQWKVAKQWCLLCLMVQAVLLTEGILVITNTSLSFSETRNAFANNLIFAFYSLLIPSISWFLLKPLLKRLQVAKYEKRSYSMLKFNDQVFWSLLKNQPSILEHSTNQLGITIGNPNAKHTIIKVCNPYCGPCAMAHPEIEMIIESNPEAKAQIIFTTTNHENDRGAKPVKLLLAVSENGDENLTKTALDDWYLAKEKNYDVFANKYPMYEELEKQTDKINQMKDWCEKVKIEFTPTIFIDGYQLPKGYQIKDINYFLS
ncbi:vitamin K epoxide reductase family protein [Sediminibacterium sp.]|uniref:vitamin K epoxide reductase family protein n=1 Tax=Sediminibacterium sp. TaxID=1917865 RepID=UPI0027354A59|nr:vitamin K epoxide reductase family protein [Sediminibacterium sp.]MDP3394315.1 vitamin K epoxide reductase family protein [Sediminibacterium sp.]MDP3568150.1 vitamin K epoxide reductase family protein [Sediminibacterium sp.]